MKYNITDKLKFDEDPILQIKDIELTVKSDAETVLKLMDVVTGEGELAGATKAMELLLSAKDQKKLTALHLKTYDYIAVMMAAVNLALGEDPEEPQGE